MQKGLGFSVKDITCCVGRSATNTDAEINDPAENIEGHTSLQSPLQQHYHTRCDV
jgi:hypothetical protein